MKLVRIILYLFSNMVFFCTEKKSVRELAASLYKQTKESPDNQRKHDSGNWK